MYNYIYVEILNSQKWLQITLLNLKDGSVTREIHESESPILSIAELPNQLFIVGRQDGNCAVLSLQEAWYSTRVQLTGPDCDGIRDIAFNEKWIFTACRDTYIRKYDFNQINVHFKWHKVIKSNDWSMWYINVNLLDCWEF